MPFVPNFEPDPVSDVVRDVRVACESSNDMLPSSNVAAHVLARGARGDCIRNEEQRHRFLTSDAYMDLVYEEHDFPAAMEDAVAHGLPLTRQMQAVHDQTMGSE
jgi:hypothetical protein